MSFVCESPHHTVAKNLDSCTNMLTMVAVLFRTQNLRLEPFMALKRSIFMEALHALMCSWRVERFLCAGTLLSAIAELCIIWNGLQDSC